MAANDDLAVVTLPPRINTLEPLDEMLIAMANAGGNDLFLQGNNECYIRQHNRIRRISNRRIQTSEVELLLSAKFGDHVKGQLGAGKPVNEVYSIELPNRKFLRFRTHAISCNRNGTSSVTVTMRVIPSIPPTAAELGVEPDLVEAVATSKQGMIVVAGATGQGKSTLQAAILRTVMEEPAANQNLVTFEDPIEFLHEGYSRPSSIVTQTQIGLDVENFSEGLKEALRMAPTIILIGETRNYPTAIAAVTAANTGHLLLTTVHANRISATIQRLVSLYPESLQHQGRIDMALVARTYVAQRLIPTVDNKRVAVREILHFDNQMQMELATSTNITTTAQSLVERYGKPMMVDVEARYKEGRISKQTLDAMKLDYESGAGGH